MTGDPDRLARRLWNVAEPLHAVIYFAPEVHDAYRNVGLKGFWMGYFAGRAHPLGAASPELVTATFFNFAPAMVHRAIPDAWDLAAPRDIGTTRLAAVESALHRLLGDLTHSRSLLEAADLAEEAVTGCALAGRPLFASHAALQWPQEPLLRLWHATTLLREHRGDGHIAANVAAGLSGLDTHVLIAAGGSIDRSHLQPNRGWSDLDWDASTASLRDRGLLDAGGLTPSGVERRARLEATTDHLAAAPVHALGTHRATRLAELLHPLAERIVANDGIPVPNPMAVPWPPP